MSQILTQVAEAALAGFVSALCMTTFEFPFWRKWGMGGVAEWQVNSVLVGMIFPGSKFHRFTRIKQTVAMHLLHGLILGIIFWFLLHVLLAVSSITSVLVVAILYSILLWIISPYATRSMFESKGKFLMTGRGLAVSFLSHIIYGFFLGLFVFSLGI